MSRRNACASLLLALGLLLLALVPLSIIADRPSPGAPGARATGRKSFLPVAFRARPPANPPSGPIYWGVSMDGSPADIGRLNKWERDVAGKGVSIIHWGHSWGQDGGYRPWSNSAVNKARGHGSIPMISWSPEGGDKARWQLRRIINGEHDGYIREFAAAAQKWGHPLLLRMMHEMNGNWGYPWQEDVNGNHRGEFVPAWRRIVDIFRQAGADNVSFVWCPNKIYPNTTYPSYASLYPGDRYVDWTCLDGYNWGSQRREGWESFDAVFGYSYGEVLKVAPGKPLMIGEFGVTEHGGSKADWLADALARIPAHYPRVRAALYYNWAMDGVDWRVESSATAAGAWRAGIARPNYATNAYGGIAGRVPVP